MFWRLLERQNNSVVSTQKACSECIYTQYLHARKCTKRTFRKDLKIMAVEIKLQMRSGLIDVLEAVVSAFIRAVDHLRF